MYLLSDGLCKIEDEWHIIDDYDAPQLYFWELLAGCRGFDVVLSIWFVLKENESGLDNENSMDVEDFDCMRKTVSLVCPVYDVE